MIESGQFDKFTERAKKVLMLAQEEAQRFQHNYIGTEHLLLGLVREGEGVAAKVLANLNIELNKVRSAVEFIIGRGDRIVLGELRLTPRAKKVIELAVDEARRLKHHYIGTEHLLLGLVREGGGIGAGVLESLGADLEKVRTQTILVLSQSRVPTEPVATLAEEAKQALAFAEGEARNFQHKLVRTEHLLAGILCLNKGGAVTVLHRLGVDIASVRSMIEFTFGHGSDAVTGKIELSPDAQKAVESATEEARALQQDTVQAEHLLLGLVSESNGSGGGLLEGLGVSPAEARKQTRQMLATNGESWRETVTRQGQVPSWLAESQVASACQSYLAGLLSSTPSISAYLEERASDSAERLRELMHALEAVLREKEAALQQQEYELAAELRDREVKIRTRMSELEGAARDGQRTGWQSELEVYPFKDVKLSRADIAWLLLAHEENKGPVDWGDPSQRVRKGLDLRGADLRGADLYGLPLACIRGGQEWEASAGVHLEDANLSAAHLEGACLFWAHLEGANLSAACLEGANLAGAHLDGANLAGAHLEGANLSGARLEKANLTAAHLEGANLCWAHLEDARLERAHLEGANLSEAFLK